MVNLMELMTWAGDYRYIDRMRRDYIETGGLIVT